MTAKILKSEISAIHNFEMAVAQHALFVREHAEHMARVADDEKNGVEGIAKHQPYPAPKAHPVIMRAIDSNGAADYKIEDDGPTSAQIIAAKKYDLSVKLTEAENAASNAVWSFAKRRMDNLRENDIRQADVIRSQDIGVRGLLATVILGPKDISPQIEAARPADDTAFLKLQSERGSKVAALQRISAQAQSDIEDLTVDTIDAWKMPDFTK